MPDAVQEIAAFKAQSMTLDPYYINLEQILETLPPEFSYGMSDDAALNLWREDCARVTRISRVNFWRLDAGSSVDDAPELFTKRCPTPEGRWMPWTAERPRPPEEEGLADCPFIPVWNKSGLRVIARWRAVFPFPNLPSWAAERIPPKLRPFGRRLTFQTAPGAPESAIYLRKAGGWVWDVDPEFMAATLEKTDAGLWLAPYDQYQAPPLPDDEYWEDLMERSAQNARIREEAERARKSNPDQILNLNEFLELAKKTS